jgi:hypothetical protein
MNRILKVVFAALTATIFTVSSLVGTSASDAPVTYADYGAAATQTLLGTWYTGGKWRMCSQTGCPLRNEDWGADALTFALYLRWKTTRASALVPAFAALAKSSPTYGTPCRAKPCTQWSDIPEWDAVAALREYAAIDHDRAVLAKAKAAYDVVERSTAYALGACPSIRYQQPFGGDNKLKTLETDSNAIRAALLLYGDTGDPAYLHDAIARYWSVRKYFLDSELPLYSTYVFDDGRTCRQLRQRFFASVNGNMIEAGFELYKATNIGVYLQDALATAKAVDQNLSDARGVYANLQAENDVAEPLIEAMYTLATAARQGFARAWLLRNAAAAVGARATDGSYGRFFDGPAPTGAVTAWQTNGGLALMIAAAQIAPDGLGGDPGWQKAQRVVLDVHTLPATLRFTGSSIALIGTIGEECCEAGHARIILDGHETLDRSGIWQNKSCSGAAVPDAVLFAWQWPESGPHVLRLELANTNAKEGGSYVHIRGYLLK